MQPNNNTKIECTELQYNDFKYTRQITISVERGKLLAFKHQPL